MKQRFFAVLLIFGLILTLVGCSPADTIPKLDAAEEKLEEKLDKVEDSVERTLRKAVTPAPAETAETTITQAQAENIALEFSGFSAAQVTRLRTEYEMDGIQSPHKSRCGGHNHQFHAGHRPVRRADRGPCASHGSGKGADVRGLCNHAK